MHILVLLLLIFSFAACQPAPSSNTTTFSTERASQVVVTTGGEESAPKRVMLSNDEFMLSLQKPANWKSFTTDYGIVMGETFSSVAAGGELKGLLVYIFTSSLDTYAAATESTDGINTAQTIQMQIVRDPSYVGQAQVNTPQSFSWDGYDAAYYLLYDEHIDVMTMVMQIVVPESNLLLTNTISAPRGHEHRIRESLPELFSTFKVNGRHLKPDALHALPEFEFPQLNIGQSG